MNPMRSTPREEFARRQREWDAFHRWESSREPQALSAEERIAWYSAAFNFSRHFPKPLDPADIAAKVEYIQQVRQRLAHLK